MRTLHLFAALCVLLAPFEVSAFCGFYVAGGDAKLFNDATQVALVRHGNETILAMQNSYAGPLQEFALVVPVPQVLQKENVKTLPKEVFDRLDSMSAPRLVKYWEEDPCELPRLTKSVVYESVPQSAVEGGVEAQVRVEAKFEVGEYDVVVLSADESTALDTYLRQNQYNIPEGAEPYLRPYVQGGSYFFVARVDPDRVTYQDGRAVLSPLRFRYTSDEFQLPIRLGMINSQGQQDLMVYVLAPNQRFEVANYPRAFIPTNLEVDESVEASFGEFYQALFAATVEKNPGAIVTEYSWQFAGCDPCPGPTLGPKEGAYLGLDEFEDVRFWDWTITRLHARYAPNDIGEDLVFQKAEAVVGGREMRQPDGTIEQGAKPANVNNFQGRYIIRHPWRGPVWCPNPKFGRWGGPPGGRNSTTTAPSPNTRGTGLAKGDEAVDRWLEQGVTELGIDGEVPKPYASPLGRAIWGYFLSVAIFATFIGLFVFWRRRRKARRAAKEGS